MKPHWPEFILSHFIASLPGSLSIESSCANRRTTIFLKRSASPTVLRSWRIEGLAASFQSQMGSKFLHRGFANLHPNIPGLVDWIGCLAGWFVHMQLRFARNIFGTTSVLQSSCLERMSGIRIRYTCVCFVIPCATEKHVQNSLTSVQLSLYSYIIIYSYDYQPGSPMIQICI